MATYDPYKQFYLPDEPVGLVDPVAKYAQTSRSAPAPVPAATSPYPMNQSGTMHWDGNAWVWNTTPGSGYQAQVDAGKALNAGFTPSYTSPQGYGGYSTPAGTSPGAVGDPGWPSFDVNDPTSMQSYLDQIAAHSGFSMGLASDSYDAFLNQLANPYDPWASQGMQAALASIQNTPDIFSSPAYRQAIAAGNNLYNPYSDPFAGLARNFIGTDYNAIANIYNPYFDQLNATFGDTVDFYNAPGMAEYFNQMNATSQFDPMQLGLTQEFFNRLDAAQANPPNALDNPVVQDFYNRLDAPVSSAMDNATVQQFMQVSQDLQNFDPSSSVLVQEFMNRLDQPTFDPAQAVGVQELLNRVAVPITDEFQSIQDAATTMAEAITGQLFKPGGQVEQASTQVLRGSVQQGWGTQSGGVDQGNRNILQGATDYVGNYVAGTLPDLFAPVVQARGYDIGGLADLATASIAAGTDQYGRDLAALASLAGTDLSGKYGLAGTQLQTWGRLAETDLTSQRRRDEIGLQVAGGLAEGAYQGDIQMALAGLQQAGALGQAGIQAAGNVQLGMLDTAARMAGVGYEGTLRQALQDQNLLAQMNQMTYEGGLTDWVNRMQLAGGMFDTSAASQTQQNVARMGMFGDLAQTGMSAQADIYRTLASNMADLGLGAAQIGADQWKYGTGALGDMTQYWADRGFESLTEGFTGASVIEAFRMAQDQQDFNEYLAEQALELARQGNCSEAANILGSAATGAGVGSAFGPIGTGIGAGVGALIGIFGGGC